LPTAVDLTPEVGAAATLVPASHGAPPSLCALPRSCRSLHAAFTASGAGAPDTSAALASRGRRRAAPGRAAGTRRSGAATGAGTASAAPEERSYDDAWAALRAGTSRARRALRARVVLLAPDGSLVEDASYWHAVALARGKRGAEAVSAFHDFLDAHGRSAHAGEAGAMLGWLLIDARAYDEAAGRFRAASGDPDPAVRNSAPGGLDALAKRTP